MISETEAWQLARDFAQAIADATPNDLLAVAVIGSLATGAYRPGRSDIDTLVVTGDHSTGQTVATIDGLRDHYQQIYCIPKGLGAVVVRERELWPPYDPEQELAPEILRLKRQGVLVWGALNLASIPEPTAADLQAYIRVFYRWLHANYVAQRPEEARTVDATVNTILYELRLLIWWATGDYVLDKRAVIWQAMDLSDSHELQSILMLLQEYLDEDTLQSIQFWEDALQAVTRQVYARLPELMPTP